ncbi:DUF2218 domain-containing protein [Pseudomonas alkylphenolica]|uniref:DUF2218 domain-containing protein n=1 Tax=Pseudomonas alkylphenolica TaxID=237609 RepID=A0A077FGC2_9PSED|nr:DUF2218 domain-containing protein [Pseudomonas alkylphenolica]AIL62286.1 hypothetical protein PSAKL28_31100 [Pseudomonas alkylphenolica]
MFVSTAQIATDNPQRLITRLCKHWSHKFSVICDEQQGEIELNIGHCLLKALEGGLHVRLQAAEEEQIQHLQTVVGDHLQRMDSKPLPDFVWNRQAS